MPWLFKSTQMHEIFCLSHLYGTQPLWIHISTCHPSHTRRTQEELWISEKALFSVYGTSLPLFIHVTEFWFLNVKHSATYFPDVFWFLSCRQRELLMWMWEFHCKGDFSCNVLGSRGASCGHVFIKICHPLVVAQGEHMFTLNMLWQPLQWVNIKAPLIQACIMSWCVPFVCNIQLLCVSGALQLFFFWNSRILKRKKKTEDWRKDCNTECPC